jgi:hypothetical protein
LKYEEKKEGTIRKTNPPKQRYTKKIRRNRTQRTKFIKTLREKKKKNKIRKKHL